MVQIDIPLPKSCLECPLKTIEEDFGNDYYYWCPAIKTAIRGASKNLRRFRKCPLKKVKKDCSDCILDGTDACSRGAGRAVDDEICEDFLKGE